MHKDTIMKQMGSLMPYKPDLLGQRHHVAIRLERSREGRSYILEDRSSCDVKDAVAFHPGLRRSFKRLLCGW